VPLNIKIKSYREEGGYEKQKDGWEEKTELQVFNYGTEVCFL
jgi:hypothetical protein